MKIPSISLIEILSPRSPGPGGVRPPRPAPPPSLPDTPCDLPDLSRPAAARPPRRCACPEILGSCLCGELTRTRDGVCDLCLYGIHIEEKGEIFGDGYRVNSPASLVSSARSNKSAVVHAKKRSVDGRVRRGSILKQNDEGPGRLGAQASRSPRARETPPSPPIRVVVAGRAPVDFDEHGMF